MKRLCTGETSYISNPLKCNCKKKTDLQQSRLFYMEYKLWLSINFSIFVDRKIMYFVQPHANVKRNLSEIKTLAKIPLPCVTAQDQMCSYEKSQPLCLLILHRVVKTAAQQTESQRETLLLYLSLQFTLQSIFCQYEVSEDSCFTEMGQKRGPAWAHSSNTSASSQLKRPPPKKSIFNTSGL